jgi:hypothetical protein
MLFEIRSFNALDGYANQQEVLESGRGFATPCQLPEWAKITKVGTKV